MSRVTIAELRALTAMVDVALDLPAGTHEINRAYGQPRLMRDGGSVDVSPRLPNGTLELWLRAYLAGIWKAKEATR